MSILQLIADIPVNSNLRIKVSDLEKENLALKSEITVLKSKLENSQMEIATLKKVPRPPLNVIYNPGYTPDRNML